MHVSSADSLAVAAVADAERCDLVAVGRTVVGPTAADIAGVVAVVDVAAVDVVVADVAVVAVVADAVVDVSCLDNSRLCGRTGCMRSIGHSLATGSVASVHRHARSEVVIG